MGCIASDFFEQIAPFIGDSGIGCVNTDAKKQQCLDQLNIAIPTLLKRLDAANTLAYWNFCIHDGCFWLPEDCLECRQIWVNGQSAEQRDEWYQGKLGIGLERCSPWNNPWIRSCGPTGVIDLGDGFAIPSPWPQHRNIKAAFIAESNADIGKEIRVRLVNPYGDEIDETVVLAGDSQPAITINHVSDIRLLHKPVTDGGVKLYVYYDHRSLRSSFAYYAPWVTGASFRRKKINGCVGNAQILVKGKLRFRKLLTEHDYMQICDGEALGFAVLAQAAKRKRDNAGYNENLAFAVNELQKEMQNAHSAASSGQIVWKSPVGRATRPRVWS